MRIGKIIEMTYAEGPGCRFCIWVQGCNHKCKGCFAEDEAYIKKININL